MTIRVMGALVALTLAFWMKPISVALAAVAAAPGGSALPPLKITPSADGVGRVTLSEAEWKRRLTREQFYVLREQGTEIAFTGKYWNNHATGTYRCAACGLELFSSATKFESGTGWPSFWQPIAANHVRVATDNTLGMQRDEVACARCGGHLGHVFDDGPAPTHLRYCMDSISLEFVSAKR